MSVRLAKKIATGCLCVAAPMRSMAVLAWLAEAVHASEPLTGSQITILIHGLHRICFLVTSAVHMRTRFLRGRTRVCQLGKTAINVVLATPNTSLHLRSCSGDIGAATSRRREESTKAYPHPCRAETRVATEHTQPRKGTAASGCSGSPKKSVRRRKRKKNPELQTGLRCVPLSTESSESA